MERLIIPYQELSGNYNSWAGPPVDVQIIPYQELSGNYNFSSSGRSRSTIIPYQELSGNYNKIEGYEALKQIIPYQELSGNYNVVSYSYWRYENYTIPRTIRELQPLAALAHCTRHYTIPRTIRELQPEKVKSISQLRLYHTKNYQRNPARPVTARIAKLTQRSAIVFAFRCLYNRLSLTIRWSNGVPAGAPLEKGAIS